MHSERKPWTPEADERLRLAVIGGKSLDGGFRDSGTLRARGESPSLQAEARLAGDRDEPSCSGEVGLSLDLVPGSD
jgi:hypothetical protein